VEQRRAIHQAGQRGGARVKLSQKISFPAVGLDDRAGGKILPRKDDAQSWGHMKVGTGMGKKKVIAKPGN